jgi:hypothetical protein
MNEITKYGQDICFLLSHCSANSQAALEAKGIVVQLCHPGLFHEGWTDYYHYIDNKNHFGDLEWTVAQMKALVEKSGMSGRFATWRVPFSMAATSAAVEYAIGYCEGEIESKTDIAAMRGCFKKAMEMYNADDIGFELNVDVEHNNHFMFTEDYIVF